MGRFFNCLRAVTVFFSVAFMISSCGVIDEITGTYTVTFDSKGGSKVEEQRVKSGELITKPADPSREGHTFDGWAKADNESSALWNFNSETVTSSMTLYARWTINTYRVTFDSDGGSAVSAQNVPHGDRVIKPNDPTRTGYQFDGWFNGASEWNFSTAVVAALTLKAKWTQVHVVTFDADNGSTPITQIIRNNEKVARPENPTRAFSPVALLFAGTVDLKSLPTHDTFVEWRKAGDNTAYNFDLPITAPITLKAVWNSSNVQGAIDISTQSGINRAEQAFTYVKNNPAEYTLLIGTNLTIARQSLNVSHLRLTIIGLGTQRAISFSDNTSPSITVGAQQRVNISLALGNNIKLNAGNIQVTNGAEFYMLEGSEISGNSDYSFSLSGDYAAVQVLSSATFTMKGGEIKNNIPSITDYLTIHGVFVDGGTFNMEGGKIKNNGKEDLFIWPSSSFTISGNAEVGSAYLATNGTVHSTIAVSPGWNGMIDILNFCGDYNYGSITSLPTLINYWVGKQILTGTGVNATTVAKIFSLGDFIYSSRSYTQAITAYVINSNGILATK